MDTIPHSLRGGGGRLCKSSRNRFWAPFQEKTGVWIGVRIGVPMGVRTGVWIRFHTPPEGVLDAFIEGGESYPNPYPNPYRIGVWIGVRIGVWTRFPPSQRGRPGKAPETDFGLLSQPKSGIRRVRGGESYPNPYPNPYPIGVRIGVWIRFPPSGGGPPWKSSGNRF